MEKWELARYMIDAKKSVDTILYLSLYAEKVSMVDIRGIVNETRRAFYINACIVLDKCFPKKKKEICKNALIQSVYYERDKNYAHKDESYADKQYDSISSMADEMKCQLEAIRKSCASSLPDVLTLDYLAFDSKLFRIANGVTKDMEEAALNIKHPGRLHQSGEEETRKGKIYSLFSDTEDIKRITEGQKKEYAAILQTGIVVEETLQRLQDGCIRTNVLHRTEMWVTVNYERLSEIKKMRELGLLDICDVPIVPQNREEERKILDLLKSEGLF